MNYLSPAIPGSLLPELIQIGRLAVLHLCHHVQLVTGKGGQMVLGLALLGERVALIESLHSGESLVAELLDGVPL